jgi:hypothetical protein
MTTSGNFIKKGDCHTVKSIILTAPETRDLDRKKVITVVKAMKPQPPKETNYLKDTLDGEMLQPFTVDGEPCGIPITKPFLPGQVVFIREPWKRIGDKSNVYHFAADAVSGPDTQNHFAWSSPVSMPADAVRYYGRVEKILAVVGTEEGGRWEITVKKISKSDADSIEAGLQASGAADMMQKARDINDGLRAGIVYFDENATETHKFIPPGDQFAENMKKAIDLGLNSEIIEKLSDGSADSTDSMRLIAEIAKASKDEIAAINESYQTLKKQKEAYAAMFADAVVRGTGMDEPTGLYAAAGHQRLEEIRVRKNELAFALANEKDGDIDAYREEYDVLEYEETAIKKAVELMAVTELSALEASGHVIRNAEGYYIHVGGGEGGEMPAEGFGGNTYFGVDMASGPDMTGNMPPPADDHETRLTDIRRRRQELESFIAGKILTEAKDKEVKAEFQVLAAEEIAVMKAAGKYAGFDFGNIAPPETEERPAAPETVADAPGVETREAAALPASDETPTEPPTVAEKPKGHTVGKCGFCGDERAVTMPGSALGYPSREAANEAAGRACECRGPMSLFTFLELPPAYYGEASELRAQELQAREIAYGTCHHCGQLLAVGKGMYTQMDADADAEGICKCPSAMHHRRIVKNISEGRDRIQQLFGPGAGSLNFKPIDASEPVELLNDAVEKVARHQISSITLAIWGTCKAKIGLTAKGKIKVERSEAHSCQLEAGE